MSTYLNLECVASGGLPAIDAGRSASVNLRSIIRYLKRFPEYATGTVRASIPGGTKASGTLTAATVVNGNTAAINGVTFTAAQKHATGTFTMSSVADGVTASIAGVTFTAQDAAPGANEYLQTG